ncbi:TonB-dependent receptor plug domain-containing protein, partial [Klebsiella pneumoniae]
MIHLHHRPLAVAVALCVTALAPLGAAAQSTTNLDAVEVTGTRIKRAEVEGQVPIQTLTRGDIERTGLTSIGEVLQQLTGSGSALNAKFNSSGNFGFPPDGSGVGAGSAQVDLRHLGAKRVLVLVDGIRWVNESSASGVGSATDLNTIPLAIVERIEVLEDGASSLYGSDAIAGVVNIILRDQADGPEATLQTGLSSRGDASQYRVQAATGGLRGSGDRWFASIDLHRVDHLAGDQRDWHAETSQYLIGAFRDGDYWPATRCDGPLKRRNGACWFDSSRPRSLQPASDTASAYLRYRHERGQGRYVYAEARASHNRQRFDLGPTAVALGLYGYTFNSVLREAGNVRPQVRATDADLTLGIGRDQGSHSWDAGISAQRSDVTLATPGTVRAEPFIEAAQSL